MDVVLSSLYVDGDARPLKLACLYCDTVAIPDYGSAAAIPIGDWPDGSPQLGDVGKAFFFASWKCIPAEIRPEVELLEREGVVTIKRAFEPIAQGTLMGEFEKVRDSFFILKGEGVYETSCPEIVSVGRCVLPGLSVSEGYEEHVADLDFMSQFFGGMAEVSLSASIQEKRPLLTDSEVMHDIIANAIKSNSLNDSRNAAQHRSHMLAHRVLDEFLPGVQDCPIEELLDVRVAFAAELEQFRQAIRKLSGNLSGAPWSSDLAAEIAVIVETKVKPSVHELRQALTQSRKKMLPRVFDALNDPQTYVPMVGTALAGLNPYLAGLVGAGIATSKVLAEFVADNQKVKDDNGFMFLLKPPESLVNTKTQSRNG